MAATADAPAARASSADESSPLRWFWGQIFRLAYWHGLLCASNPFVTLVGAVVTLLVISAPGYPVLFRPAPVRHTVWRSGVNDPPAWMSESPPANRVQQIVIINDKGRDSLCPDLLDKAGFRFPEHLATFASTWDEQRRITLPALCTKHEGVCLMVSPKPFLDYNISNAYARPRSLLAKRKRVQLLAGPEASRDLAFVGFVEKGFESSARAISVSIPLTPSANDDIRRAERKFFTDAIADFGAKVAAKPGADENQAVQAADSTFVLFEPERRKIGEEYFLTLCYALVFLYIYVTVDKFQLVKSKFWLGVAAVVIVFGSMAMSVSICHNIGLVTQFTAVEVVPFFIMAIGLDNMIIITKSVVSSSPHMAVRFRVAEGLAIAAPSLLKSLVTMEGILLLGVYSKIEALQSFCIVACVGILCDFFLQIVFYVTVLGLDVRRVELSDLAQPHMGNIGNRHAKPVSQLSADEQAILRKEQGSHFTLVLKSACVVLAMVLTLSVPLFGGAISTEALPDQQLHQAFVGSDYSAFLRPASEDGARLQYLELLPNIVMKLSEPRCDPPASPLPTQFAIPLHQLAANKVFTLFEHPTMLVCTIAGVIVFVFVVLGAIRTARRALFGDREGTDAVAAFTMAHFDVRTLSGHRQDVECLTSTRSGDIVASACLGGQVRVWDLSAQRCLAVLRCGYDESDNTREIAPWSLALHAQFVAVGCANGNVEVWDVQTRGCAILKLPRSDAVDETEEHQAPGGIMCLLFSETALYTASSTGDIEMWAWEAPSADFEPTTRLARSDSTVSMGGTEYNYIKPKHVPPPPLQGSPGSARGGGGGSGGGNDVLRSSNSANSLQQLAAPRHRTHRRVLSGDAGTSSWAQPVLARRRSMDRDDAARLTRTPSSSSIASSVDGDAPAYKSFYCVSSFKGHKAAINAMQHSNSHLITASADRVVKVFELRDLTVHCVLTGHEDAITSLHVLDDGSAVTSSADRTVREWDTVLNGCRHVYRGHTDRVLCARLNESFVVSSAEDDTVRVWQRQSGRCVLMLSMSEAYVDFALHSSSILVTACEGKLTAWDLMAHGERLRTVSLMDEVVPTCLHSPPGSVSTNHIILRHDRIICDLGRLVKFVSLPFPCERRLKSQ